MKRLIPLVLGLVAFALFLTPVGATITTSTADFGWEFYNNTNLGGTTSVTLSRPAVSVLIRNLGPGSLLLVAAGEAVPSTGAHITIASGTERTVTASSGVSVMSSLQFWCSATCAVEILSERYR